jgi:hypothetical protein
VNHIVSKNVDIFSKGPIKDTLKNGLYRYLNTVKKNVGSTIYSNKTNWDDYFTKYWFTTICRLILRIKGYRHGGALLFYKRKDQGLNLKYPISYSRLRLSLEKRAEKLVRATYASDQIERRKDENNIPVNLYIDEIDSKDDLRDIRSEIDGTLWFISLLSRVDGLVLINKNLEVHGFGVEITSSNPPAPGKIFICSQRIPKEGSLKEVDYNHFGTRHRSMMRYCWQYPGTVGFVISQDGDVRAMTKCDDKLIIWDDIRLQADTFVKKRLRK